MSKREKIVFVMLVAIGVAMIRGKDEIRMLGIVILVLGGATSIFVIGNIFLANRIFRYLIRDILIIKNMEKEKDNASQSSLKIICDKCIDNALKDATRCIKSLKKSKWCLSEELYKYVLDVEGYLTNNTNLK